MKDRENLKNAFLAQNNLSSGIIEKLPQDASFRSYFRIKQDGKSTILMDADTTKEDVKQFVKVASFLAKNKFSVPEVIAADEKKGFLLLEDFGDDTFAKLLIKEPERETELYEKAIDLLIALHKVQAADNLLPYFSDEVILEEAKIFTDWYVPTLFNETVSKKSLEEYEIIYRHLFQYVRLIPETNVLKDYHSENLMWLDDRNSINKVGLLDFQSAMVGSPIYDIVSLLEDARRDVSQDLTQAMINRYLEARPEISRKNFLATYAILSAHRNLRIVGVFARKATRDGNSNYLKYLPRVWGYIEKNLRHPLLVPFKSWLDKVISPELRNKNKAKVNG